MLADQVSVFKGVCLCLVKFGRAIIKFGQQMGEHPTDHKHANRPYYLPEIMSRYHAHLFMIILTPKTRDIVPNQNIVVANRMQVFYCDILDSRVYDRCLGGIDDELRKLIFVRSTAKNRSCVRGVIWRLGIFSSSNMCEIFSNSLTYL